MAINNEQRELIQIQSIKTLKTPSKDVKRQGASAAAFTTVITSKRRQQLWVMCLWRRIIKRSVFPITPWAGGQELGDNGHIRFRGGGKLCLFLCMAEWSLQTVDLNFLISYIASAYENRGMSPLSVFIHMCCLGMTFDTRTSLNLDVDPCHAANRA